MSGRTPRAPRKGSEIEPNPLRPHVAAIDCIQAWQTPYSIAFDEELKSRFPDLFCENYFKVLNASLDNDTKEAYGSGILRFTQFCDVYKIPEKDRMPASVVLLSAFLSFYAGKVSGSAVKNWMSGIAAWHAMSGAPWYGDQALVTRMKTGVARLAPSSSRCQPRPPASLQHILVLLQFLDLSNPFDIVVAVVAVCAFLACCRLGELTVPSRAGYSDKLHVSRSAKFSMSTIAFGDCSSVITELPILWTKTMKELGATLRIIDTVALPFSELFQSHLRINEGAPQSGHLFAYKDKDGLFVPLTKSAFLKRCYEIWKAQGMCSLRDTASVLVV